MEHFETTRLILNNIPNHIDHLLLLRKQKSLNVLLVATTWRWLPWDYNISFPCYIENNFWSVWHVSQFHTAMVLHVFISTYA